MAGVALPIESAHANLYQLASQLLDGTYDYVQVLTERYYQIGGVINPSVVVGYLVPYATYLAKSWMFAGFATETEEEIGALQAGMTPVSGSGLARFAKLLEDNEADHDITPASGGTLATITISGAANGDMTYTSKIPGAGADAMNVAHRNPGDVSQALSVAVVERSDGADIIVSLKTDAGGNVTSTATEVAAAVTAHATASKYATATAGGTGAGVVGVSVGSVTRASGNANGDVLYSSDYSTEVESGTVNILHADPGAASQALTIELASAFNVRVWSKTDVAGTPDSTSAEVAAAIEASVDVDYFLDAAAEGDGTGIVGFVASALQNSGNANGDVTYACKTYDYTGNIRILHTDPGAASQALAVAVSVKDIIVRLATDVGGAVTSTAAEVAAAIIADAPAYALVKPVEEGTGAGVVKYVASALQDSVNANGDVTYACQSFITGPIRILHQDPGAIDQALAVAVAAEDIIVSLATDGAGAVTSTAALVAAAILAEPTAVALVDANEEGDGSGVVKNVACAVQNTVNPDGDVTYVCKSFITGPIRILHQDPGDINAALAVAVSSEDIIVSLATDGAGAVTSTAALVAAAVIAEVPAFALVNALEEGAGTGVVENVACVIKNTANPNGDVTYHCRGFISGPIRVYHGNPAGNNQLLSVSVTGNDVTVLLATGGAGAVTSTATQVTAAVIAEAPAYALVGPVAEGTGAGLVHEDFDTFTMDSVPANSDVDLTSVGIVTQVLRCKFTDPLGNNQPLTINQVDGDVEVLLATDGVGAITSTSALVVAAINADPGASAIMFAAPEGAGGGIVEAIAWQTLTGKWSTITGAFAQIDAEFAQIDAEFANISAAYSTLPLAYSTLAGGTTMAGQATLLLDSTNVNADLTVTAVGYGTHYNQWGVALIDPGDINQALAITVSGFDVSISLATDGAGAITSTANLIKAAWDAIAGLLQHVGTIAVEGTGLGVVEAIALARLSGGVGQPDGCTFNPLVLTRDKTEYVHGYAPPASMPAVPTTEKVVFVSKNMNDVFSFV